MRSSSGNVSWCFIACACVNGIIGQQFQHMLYFVTKPLVSIEVHVQQQVMHGLHCVK